MRTAVFASSVLVLASGSSSYRQLMQKTGTQSNASSNAWSINNITIYYSQKIQATKGSGEQSPSLRNQLNLIFKNSDTASETSFSYSTTEIRDLGPTVIFIINRDNINNVLSTPYSIAHDSWRVYQLIRRSVNHQLHFAPVSQQLAPPARFVINQNAIVNRTSSSNGSFTVACYCSAIHVNRATGME